MKPRRWFDLTIAADEDSAEIFVFDFIGDWIDDWFGFDDVTTAKSFVDALASLPESVKELAVRINSPGGDFFGGVTIANALRAEQERGRSVVTIVEGLAGSAASVIAMGGQTVRVADNGLFMIHAPWTVVGGNAAELRKYADELDKMRNSLVKTYQWHSKLDSNAIVALIDGPDGQGSWLDADEAIDSGLATEKVEGLRAAASIDRRALSRLKVPEQYQDRVKAFIVPEASSTPPAKDPDPVPVVEAAPAAEVLRLCREAGCLDLAEDLVSAESTLEAVHARLADEKTKRTAAATREKEIRALCKLRGLDELADGYATGGMPIETVRAQLTAIAARLDSTEIDTGLPPDGAPRGKSVIDVTNVYRELNQLPAAKE